MTEDRSNGQVAFLIVCHAEPEMLARLARRLVAPGCASFVHVNVRSDIAAFRQATAGIPALSFVADDDRVAVNWCGYSLIRAVLAAIRLALAEQPDTQRFVLLTGADYPIKPLPDILAEIRKNHEIIKIDRRLDWNGRSWFDRTVTNVFLGDNNLFNQRSPLKPVRLLGRLIERFARRWRRYSLPIYNGPSWWSLTRAAMDEALAIAADPATDIAWFSRSRTPDETVFHTLVRNSSRAGAIKLDAIRDGADAYPESLAGTHYVDWHRPNPDYPRILVDSDLSAILASDALFARKFHPARSATLMYALDQLHGVAEDPVPQG